MPNKRRKKKVAKRATKYVKKQKYYKSITYRVFGMSGFVTKNCATKKDYDRAMKHIILNRHEIIEEK